MEAAASPTARPALLPQLFAAAPVGRATGKPAEYVSRFFETSPSTSASWSACDRGRRRLHGQLHAGGERWSPELLQRRRHLPGLRSAGVQRAARQRVVRREWDAFARRRIDARVTARLGRTRRRSCRSTGRRPTATSLPRVSATSNGSPRPRCRIPTSRCTTSGRGSTACWPCSRSNAYRAVVWRLAQRIVAIHRALPGANRWVPASVDELRNRFAEEAAA